MTTSEVCAEWREDQLFPVLRERYGVNYDSLLWLQSPVRAAPREELQTNEEARVASQREPVLSVLLPPDCVWL